MHHLKLPEVLRGILLKERGRGRKSYFFEKISNINFILDQCGNFVVCLSNGIENRLIQKVLLIKIITLIYIFLSRQKVDNELK